MKLLWKSVLIAFVLHILLDVLVISYHLIFNNGSDFGYYGVLGGAVYVFIFSFWAYVLIVLIYGLYCKKQRSLWQRLAVSGTLVFLLYIGMRIPDMLDDDFWTNFSLWHLVLIAMGCGLLIILWEKIYPKIGS
jgi:uncharacterized membrane protein